MMKMYSMIFGQNDYELVIKKSKYFEQQLQSHFGASGKGLHEKVTSVQGKLPQELVKRLRYIATIRNKLVHDDGIEKLDDKNGFIEACEHAESTLKSLTLSDQPMLLPIYIGLFIILIVIWRMWVMFG